MRGNDDRLQPGMFSYVSLEERVPTDHPLREIRDLVDAVLRKMSAEFDGLYAAVGRPPIPPERLFCALLLQVFYSIRSERLLMEQLNYNLLFRWFVGLEIDDEVWNHAVFSKNRDSSRCNMPQNEPASRSTFLRILCATVTRPTSLKRASN
jgi:transposase